MSASGFGMIQSIKFNLGQKRSNRFGRKRYANTKRKFKKLYTLDLTKEELEKIKADIRAKGKRQRLIENSIVAILSLIVFSIIYIYLF
ncbi:MAG: hypothetical protein QM478_01300 [Flavobacteriaceae bacterium]